MILAMFFFLTKSCIYTLYLSSLCLIQTPIPFSTDTASSVHFWYFWPLWKHVLPSHSCCPTLNLSFFTSWHLVYTLESCKIKFRHDTTVCENKLWYIKVCSFILYNDYCPNFYLVQMPQKKLKIWEKWNFFLFLIRYKNGCLYVSHAL